LGASYECRLYRQNALADENSVGSKRKVHQHDYRHTLFFDTKRETGRMQLLSVDQTILSVAMALISY
jgi:hypothetical protein